MLGAGDEKARNKLLDLLSHDTDVAQETKENVTEFMVWDLGCVFKGALVYNDNWIPFWNACGRQMKAK